MTFPYVDASFRDKFQVIKQIKLNTPENPCLSSPDYTYQKCIEENVIKEIGCQPSWVKSTKTKNETCPREKITKYLWRLTQVTYAGQKTIFLKYGCQRPCEYYEYKVNKKVIK